MIVSGIAIGQWNQICRKKEGIRRTRYKILRAFVMGRLSHTYKSKDYIVRYCDLNLLVSHTGVIMTVWRDKSTPNVIVDEEFKTKYDITTTHKENAVKANKRHVLIIRDKWVDPFVFVEEDGYKFLRINTDYKIKRGYANVGVE